MKGIKLRREKPSGTGVRGQVIFGFGIFTLVIIILLWVFQIFLLNPFYRVIKITEIKNVAAKIENHLEKDDLQTVGRELCATTGVSIFVTDELGRMYLGLSNSFKETAFGVADRLTRVEVFNQVNLQGGTRMETYKTPEYTYGGGTELLLYATLVHTPSGLNRMILLEGEITPVDSTVETLKVQLMCLSVVMVVLGVGLSLFIARKISRPITAINESAKGLAQGDYTMVFSETGCREVRELGQTLNYAARELSKVESLRRELLANVSHDLRTPLTMIKGYSEVMRDLPGENTPENVQIIIDETARLTDLVNDLLDLSRLESGVVALDRTRFNLTESIRTMLVRYDKLAEYSFPFAYNEEIYVVGDELRISQAVYNLVNNAITYAGEDKTVRLSQTVDGHTVRISVSDTGEGIPADQLQNIWERYYKVDKEHKRAQVGTGLGLSIVRNVLESHGGRYGVESQEGLGSTFWFELPLQTDFLESPEDSKSLPEEAGMDKAQKKEYNDSEEFTGKEENNE